MIPISPAHTPGEWQIGVAGNCNVVSYNDGNIIGVAKCEKHNAPLIAAAPDLLRELALLVKLIGTGLDDGRISIPGLATLNGPKAAIFKATGKDPT